MCNKCYSLLWMQCLETSHNKFWFVPYWLFDASLNTTLSIPSTFGSIGGGVVLDLVFGIVVTQTTYSFRFSLQLSRKLFLTACQTFLAPVRHFSQLMTGKYQWSFLFSLSDILCTIYSTLWDEMSAKVWARHSLISGVVRNISLSGGNFWEP